MAFSTYLHITLHTYIFIFYFDGCTYDYVYTTNDIGMLF